MIFNFQAMPRRKKSRRCTGCRRPCKDHLGPTGSRCAFKASALDLEVGKNNFDSLSPPLVDDNCDPYGPRFVDNPQVPVWPSQSAKSPSRPSSAPGAGHEFQQRLLVNSPRATMSEPTFNTPPGDHGRAPIQFAEHIIPSPAQGYGVSPNVFVSHHSYRPPLPPSGGLVQSIANPLVSVPLPDQMAPYRHAPYTSAPLSVNQSDPWLSRAPPATVYTSATYTSALSTDSWLRHAPPTTSYGNHPLPAQLWHWSPPRTAVGQIPPAPAISVSHAIGVIPTHPGSAPQSHQPPVTFGAPPGVTPVVPGTVPAPVPPAAHSLYAPGSEAIHHGHPPYAVPQYWGYAQVPQRPEQSFQPVVDVNRTTNSIHPAVHHAVNGRHALDIGLEHIDQRTVNSALQGECVVLEDFLSGYNADSDELRPNIDLMGNLQVRSVKSRKSINSVLKWLEAWVSYEMLMCKYYGYSIYCEMAKYRAFIIGISQKFKFPYVAAYDLRHRQRLAQGSSFLYSMVDHDLYVTIFDVGAVKHNSRCAKCTSSDHATSECGKPSTSNRGMGNRQRGQNRGRKGGASKSEVCYNFQSGSCTWGASCFRRHQCVGCGGDAPQSACSTASCKAATSRAAVSTSS